MPQTGVEEAHEEMAIEQQAMAVFEEEAAEHMIEELRAEEAAEEEASNKP
jgi:hypothetical protein